MCWVRIATAMQTWSKMGLKQLHSQMTPFFSDILWHSCIASHIFLSTLVYRSFNLFAGFVSVP